LLTDRSRRWVARCTRAGAGICTLLAISSVFAADARPASLPAVIRIWQGASPGSESGISRGVTYSETFTDLKGHSHRVAMIRDVQTPTLSAFWPQQASRDMSAVIICPGGGFRFLGWQTEGTDLAKWLAARGVAAFVLKYRLVPTATDPRQFGRQMTEFMSEFSQAVADGRSPRSLDEMLPDAASLRTRALASADAREAVKVVRRHALDWGIEADRIGMLGFSAGGFLVTDVIQADDPAARLDFAALIYGGELGNRNIPADAPPLFMVVAGDDPWMSGLSRQLFSKWAATGKPIELHYFHEGGHGFGTMKQGLPVDQWPRLLAGWLASQKLMQAQAPHE
jgi:acetyl esterase/lipase